MTKTNKKKQYTYGQIKLTPEDESIVKFMQERDKASGGPGTKAQIHRNMLLWLKSEKERIEHARLNNA